MGPDFEANETKRNYMKETEDVIELDVTDGFQTLKDSKNLNEVTNEQIKKKGRKQGRFNIRMESRNWQKPAGDLGKQKLTRN